MKLIIDENIVIFLDKTYLHNLDLTNKKSLEKNLIKLINKIQKRYKTDLSGYYNVFIYEDQTYGIIIDMDKENLEYIDYFSPQIDLNIELIKDNFLYKIEDIFNIPKNLLKKFTIYKNKENIYLKSKDNITNIELGIVIENSEIIYGTKAKRIINNSKIISR